MTLNTIDLLKMERHIWDVKYIEVTQTHYSGSVSLLYMLQWNHFTVINHHHFNNLSLSLYLYLCLPTSALVFQVGKD